MNFLVHLICLLFLAAVSVSLITYSFFWYENAWTARLSEDKGRGLILKILTGFLSSVAGLVFLTVFYPLGFIQRLWEPKELTPGYPVIILTHGLYHNASAWVLFRRTLRKAGFKNIFVMNYRSFFTSFEMTLTKFEEFVAKTQQTLPGQPVYLIGHSLGGLLSRVYAENSAGNAAPAAVITLGTPHRGSKMAAFGIGKLASSLLFRGPLFTELERRDAQLFCTCAALFSPVDNMVLPSEALKAPSSVWIHYQTAPLSHISMLYSKSTAKKVVEILTPC